VPRRRARKAVADLELLPTHCCRRSARLHCACSLQACIGWQLFLLTSAQPAAVTRRRRGLRAKARAFPPSCPVACGRGSLRRSALHDCRSTMPCSQCAHRHEVTDAKKFIKFFFSKQISQNKAEKKQKFGNFRKKKKICVLAATDESSSTVERLMTGACFVGLGSSSGRK
jgi:hypothetical protein